MAQTHHRLGWSGQRIGRWLLIGILLSQGTAFAETPPANQRMSDEAMSSEQHEMAAARSRLVAEIEREVEATRDYLGTDRLDPAVIQALSAVPRHRFVPLSRWSQAYANAPLPIGRGQTISQPYIVAIMSQLLDLDPGDRVFELGTGSGYQAAVLAAMGVEVFSIEIVRELAERAAATLAQLGYDGVQVRAGDGYAGWPAAAPFDGIIVTAAGPELPAALVEQLAVGGRMVIPLGGEHEVQYLTLVTKEADGQLSRRRVLPVRFVPITGSLVPDTR